MTSSADSIVRPLTTPVVRLKNGTVEADALVGVVTLSLERLFNERQDLVIDVVKLARDPQYTPFGDNRESLEALGLIDPGHGMDDSIRNIILSSVKGEEWAIILVNPLAEQPESQENPDDV